MFQKMIDNVIEWCISEKATWFSIGFFIGGVVGIFIHSWCTGTLHP